jgi:nitrogen regulatory protein PII
MLSYRKHSLLVVSLAAALLGAPLALAAEPDKLVPSDADAVVVFNVRQTLDSALVKTYALEHFKSAMKGNDQVAKLMTAAGIDPLKDVDTVTFANAGAPPKNDSLIVIHGKFQLDKVHAAAQDYAKQNPTEVKVTGEGKARVYEITVQDNKLFASFLDGNTLVAANSKEYLQGAVKKDNTAKWNKELQTALDKVKGGKDSVWVAMVVTDDMRKRLAADERTKDLATKLESVTGSVSIANDMQLSFLVNTTDAAAAQKVAKELNGLVKLLGVLAIGNEQAKPFVELITENLKVNSKDKAATIEMKISETQLKKAVSPDKDK